jgi:hypothetical protein
MCRDLFRRTKLLERIVPDIERCLGLRPEEAHLIDLSDEETQPALWDPSAGEVSGGRNYADAEAEQEVE